MEGEKEQQREEKESNEAEDDTRSDEEADNDEEEDEDSEGAALIWQEGYAEDSLGLPIMHWEALSLRIAELEKQEEEKKEKRAKKRSFSGARQSSSELGGGPREESRKLGGWRRRLQQPRSGTHLPTQMNLQLCFINDSESEEEEDEKQEETSQKESSTTRRGSVQVHKNPPPAAKPEKPKSRGFRNTLRNLRDRLRTDHKTLAAARSDPVVQRRHVERSDLQNFSIKDLKALCTSLSQTIQDLSSDLVGRLQVRDQLRTEQDAMLLEVQDLTSL